jgi:glycosyltransferase involved in cell wall biosynthesis
LCFVITRLAFVEAALDSVINQTYNDIELIVIDDGSTDGSPKIIKRWIANHPETTLLINATNLGYCKTFNKAYKISKGEYVIDLAADDILLPDRVEVGIKRIYRKLDQDYGVTFSDAEHVDEQGTLLRLTFCASIPISTIPKWGYL